MGQGGPAATPTRVLLGTSSVCETRSSQAISREQALVTLAAISQVASGPQAFCNGASR
jgi:hypothetical protein